MRLNQYLSARQESKSSFAKRSGIPTTTVTRICDISKGGGCNISTAHLIVLASIEHPTALGGVVTFEELVPSQTAA